MKKGTYFLVMVCVFTLFSCKNKNKPPEIQQLNSSKVEINVRDTLRLSCLATDADNDSLVYAWTLTGGNFIGTPTGSTSFWKAPDTTGKYSVKATVSDGKSISEKELMITVKNPAPGIVVASEPVKNPGVSIASEKPVSSSKSVTSPVGNAPEADSNSSTTVTNVMSVKEMDINNLTGTLTDSRDGKTYKTVKIGSQWWMAENLAYLPSVNPTTEGSDTTPHYYVNGYNGTNSESAKSTSYYLTYGVLYNWPAAMQEALSSKSNPSGIRGICPASWHLPSDDEWDQLAQAISEHYGPYRKASHEYNVTWENVGKHLKSTYGWKDNGNGTDDFKFQSLPAGYRFRQQGILDIGINCLWWSSTENSETRSWTCDLGCNNNYVGRHTFEKEQGLSVRCIKD